MATKAGGAYIEIRAEHKKLQSDLNAAHSKVASAAKKMEKTLNQAFKIGGAIAVAGMTAGMVALTRKVISLGREFEFNMKTVQAWSEATEKDMQALTDIARKMGATTEHSATQAAGALKFFAAAGFIAKQSIVALPGTLDLATAGQVDLALATDITTDVLTAFEMQVSELDRVSDAFITVSSSTNTNVLMLGESFKMVAPTANLFGLSVEQTAALVGVLASSGIKAEKAGTGLNMILLKSAKAAKMLGLDAMTPLVDVLKKMKEEQWGALKIEEAFGSEHVKSAAILMKKIDMYEKLTKKIIENKGATSKLAAIMRDSLEVDIKTLSSTIEEELLRVFDKYEDDIKKTIQATTEWIRQNPQAIEQVAEFTRNMAELVIVMGKVIALGAEFTNVWIKTWQALGLASTGMIDLTTALFDGVYAVNTFDEVLGPEKLRLAFLERVIATGRFTNKVYQEAKKLRKLIDALPDVDVAKPKDDKPSDAAVATEKKVEEELKGLEAISIAYREMYTKFGILTKQTYDEIKAEHQAEYDRFVLLTNDKITAQERFSKQMLKLNEDMETLEDSSHRDEALESFRQAQLSETQLTLEALELQKEHYSEFVKDKAALDAWYKQEKDAILAPGKAQELADLETYKGLLERRLELEKSINEETIILNGNMFEQFSLGMEKASEDLQSWGELWVEVGQKSNEVLANSMTNSLWDFVDGTKSAKEAFQDFGRSIISWLFQMIVKQTLLNLLTEKSGDESGAAISKTLAAHTAELASVSTLVASYISLASAKALAGMAGAISGGGSLTTAADGGVFSHGNKITEYARGGIVSEPTLFPMANGAGLMGEAGPEAILPLKRTSDGKLGVETTGDGGGSSSQPTTIIINAVDTKSFNDALQRNPAGIISIVNEALQDRGPLLSTIRQTI